MVTQPGRAQEPVRFLSPSQSAALMGCNEKTIRRRIAEGELPAFRMGKRSIRIKESDLLDLMRPIPTAHAS